jgi:hypothetical protein
MADICHIPAIYLRSVWHIFFEYLPGISMKNGWSIWLINTKEDVMLISTDGFIDNAIPDDGSFISAFIIAYGLTEDQAEILIEQMGDRVESRMQQEE